MVGEHLPTFDEYLFCVLTECTALHKYVLIKDKSKRGVVERPVTPVAPPIVGRLHHDDAAAVHQLQAEVGRAPAVAHAQLQGPQHVHRRPVCLRHQDADPLPHRLLPRRCVSAAAAATTASDIRFNFDSQQA